ncbi:MAG: Crp/Fnr family transcriptional regulator [Acidobacteria bacterium]|nr:Crp/Fnr family transcriptional regulator [Acidobacteriota bacterium]
MRRTLMYMKDAITSDRVDDRLLTDILLDQVPGIPTVVAASLSGAHQVRRYNAGDLIIREGDSSTGIFLLISGTAQALVSKPNKQVGLRNISAPAVLGVTAAMLSQPSSVSLVAVTPVETAFIPDVEFLRILAQSPKAGIAFSQLIANELMHTYSHLSQLRIARAGNAPNSPR